MSPDRFQHDAVRVGQQHDRSRSGKQRVRHRRKCPSPRTAQLAMAPPQMLHDIAAGRERRGAAGGIDAER